jgi:hypothetical protein
MLGLEGGSLTRIVRAFHGRHYSSLIILRITPLFLVDLLLLVCYSLRPGSPLCHSLGSCLYGFSLFGANVGQNFALGFAFLFLEASP